MVDGNKDLHSDIDREYCERFAEVCRSMEYVGRTCTYGSHTQNTKMPRKVEVRRRRGGKSCPLFSLAPNSIGWGSYLLCCEVSLFLFRPAPLRSAPLHPTPLHPAPPLNYSKTRKSLYTSRVETRSGDMICVCGKAKGPVHFNQTKLCFWEQAVINEQRRQ